MFILVYIQANPCIYHIYLGKLWLFQLAYQLKMRIYSFTYTKLSVLWQVCYRVRLRIVLLRYRIQLLAIKNRIIKYFYLSFGVTSVCPAKFLEVLGFASSNLNITFKKSNDRKPDSVTPNNWGSKLFPIVMESWSFKLTWQLS